MGLQNITELINAVGALLLGGAATVSTAIAVHRYRNQRNRSSPDDPPGPTAP
jgi:hypothetical protein